ncbi:hypothetical protein TSUD_107900 [Trifolium subterraneum]|uniref:Uncharacterized protein n=1 Tax=Trifolium subterraneum TaxID=3900 RepID=A0A2Z6N6L4_TRISU|nr:hypothetical protein TSUD_107900 [Trifolium subterraneum]
MYVSPNSKIRVLPSMGDSNTFEADLSILYRMMRKSVLLAFLAEVEVNVKQVVSRVLRRFLNFVSETKGATSKSGITSLCSIVGHPFIWSSMDRIGFVKKMYIKCKNDLATYNLIDKGLRKMFINETDNNQR